MQNSISPQGSPRAALLQHAVSRGQSAAQMHPLSMQRPGLNAGPVNGVMLQHGMSQPAQQNQQKQAQMLGLLMQMSQQNQGGKSPGQLPVRIRDDGHTQWGGEDTKYPPIQGAPPTGGQAGDNQDDSQHVLLGHALLQILMGGNKPMNGIVTWPQPGQPGDKEPSGPTTGLLGPKGPRPPSGGGGLLRPGGPQWS